MPVQLSDSASFQSNTNPSVTLCLTNLLHVPSLNKNLFSVSRFAHDTCVYFEFHPFVCFVKSQVDDSILLKWCLGSDGLYQISLPLLPSTVPVSPTCLSSVALSTTSSSSMSSCPKSSCLILPVLLPQLSPIKNLVYIPNGTISLAIHLLLS